MLSATDLVTTLVEARLLKHLSQLESDQLHNRAEDMTLKTPGEIISFLAEIPNLIWYFRRDLPKTYTQQKLLAVARERNVDQFVLHPHPLTETLAQIDAVNERLKQRSQTYRYYLLLAPHDVRHDIPTPHAVFFMDEHQRYTSGLHQYVDFSYSQAHTWTKRRINDILNIFKETNLLSNSDETTIQEKSAEILSQVNSKSTYLESDFLSSFGLIYSFDTETFRSWQEEYQQLLTGLTQFIDDNQFQPTNLQVVKYDDPMRLDVSFTLNDQVVEMALDSSIGWIDATFVRTINKTLQNHDALDGQLYTLEAHDQIAELVYLTQTQYEKLRPYFSLQLF